MSSKPQIEGRLHQSNGMNYTHTIKRPIQSLKKGTKVTTFYHELLKEDVIGIPRSQNDFWTPEFVAKHPEIFQPNK